MDLESIEADDPNLLWHHSTVNQLFDNLHHHFCLSRVLNGGTQWIVRTLLTHLSLRIDQQKLFLCDQQGRSYTRKHCKGLCSDSWSSFQPPLIERVAGPPHDRLRHPVLGVQHPHHAAALELLDQPLHHAHPQGRLHL